MAHDLDVITIGRSSVDLYGQQIGGRLEDMALLRQVGRRLPRQHRHRRGAARPASRPHHRRRRRADGPLHPRADARARASSIDGVTTDPERLTALVILSRARRAHLSADLLPRELRRHGARRGRHRSGLHRARRGAIVVTGTHFSTANTDAAQRKAMRIAARGRRARSCSTSTTGRTSGASPATARARSATSAPTGCRSICRPILPDCDLIVGTEEEIQIAGGAEDALAALRNIRVAQRRDHRPEARADGLRRLSRCRSRTASTTASSAAGFPIEVYNVLGAGDAFMAGFLRGWLRGEPLETCATWANACGAFAVSRLLCSPEYPTWTELQYFLKHGSTHHALRKDETLNHIHWATTRRPQPETLMALAIDHRAQLEEMADEAGAPRERIDAFKVLAVAGGRQGGRRAAGLRHAARRHLWPRGAVRAAEHPLLDRPSGRAAGLAAAPLRVRPGSRRAAGRMAGRRTRSSACASIIRTIDAALQGTSRTEKLLHALRRGARGTGASCWSRSSPASTARSATTRSRPCCDGSTRPASSRTGGSSSRRRRRRPGAHRAT